MTITAGNFTTALSLGTLDLEDGAIVAPDYASWLSLGLLSEAEPVPPPPPPPPSDSKWVAIKNAMDVMLESAGFPVKGSKGVSRTVSRYCLIVADEEENNDYPQNVGSNQYRNFRNFTIWFYDKGGESSIDIDQVKELAKTRMEEGILTQIKTLFASCYNIAGDAGAIGFKYRGMRFVDVETSGIYAPVRMEINFTCEYIEPRLITL